MALGLLGTGLAAAAGGALGAGAINWINNRSQNRKLNERFDNLQNSLNNQTAQINQGIDNRLNNWNNQLSGIYDRLNYINAANPVYPATQPVYYPQAAPVPYYGVPQQPPYYYGAQPVQAWNNGNSQYFPGNYQTVPTGNNVNYISSGNQYFGMGSPADGNPYLPQQAFSSGGNNFIGGTQNFYSMNPQQVSGTESDNYPSVVNNYYNPVFVMDDNVSPHQGLPWPSQTNFSSLPSRLDLQIATYV